MKILTGKQIREVDRATIERGGITSLELMERASEEIARWIGQNIDAEYRLIFCCGKGGNGGDGLAVARMLSNAGRECVVFLGADYNAASPEARANLQRLPKEVKVCDVTAEHPDIEPDAVIVDALLGTGATGEVREPARSMIEWINTLPNRVISIDIPSGMPSEAGWGSLAHCNAGGTTISPIIEAETTLTLEFPKLAMLLPEMGEYAGEIVVLPIDLDEKFMADTATPYYYITEEWVESLRLPRAKFSHKGTYGHALLVCGSATMPGAAILAVGGALRSGCGLVTAHIPATERFALTTNHPSAMLSLDAAECFSSVPDDLRRFPAIGVGCGLGQDKKTVDALGKLLAALSATTSKLVVDADALNIIAANPHLKQLIPAGSVLTPHPGELRRLVGEWSTEAEKLEKASSLACETRSAVIVKGAHSAVCTPDGRFIFNSTGNPGMAKGGSGDVLAGFLTGLLARGYDAETASIIGVYTHGTAGDKAAEMYGPEAMNASDLQGQRTKISID